MNTAADEESAMPGTLGDERFDGQHDPRLDPALQHIRDALRGLKFGIVTVIVQDGVVVQLERTEKCRLRRTDPK